MLRERIAYYEGGKIEKSKVANLAGIAGIERFIKEDKRPLFREDLLKDITDLAQMISEAGDHKPALDQQVRAEEIARALAADWLRDTEAKLSLVMVLTRLGDAARRSANSNKRSLSLTTSAGASLITSGSRRIRPSSSIRSQRCAREGEAGSQ